MRPRDHATRPVPGTLPGDAAVPPRDDAAHGGPHASSTPGLDDAAPVPGTSTAPADGYGRGVRSTAGATLLAGAAATGVAYLVDCGDPVRSALFGVGLVAISSAATVLVSAQMFRGAPAATAPALAALYLLKVLALGWLLLVPGPPDWLAPGAFVTGALAALVTATAVSAVLARRVSNRQARLRPAPSENHELPGARDREQPPHPRPEENA